MITKLVFIILWNKVRYCLCSLSCKISFCSGEADRLDVHEGMYFTPLSPIPSPPPYGTRRRQSEYARSLAPTHPGLCFCCFRCHSRAEVNKLWRKIWICSLLPAPPPTDGERWPNASNAMGEKGGSAGMHVRWDEARSSPDLIESLGTFGTGRVMACFPALIHRRVGRTFRLDGSMNNKIIIGMRESETLKNQTHLKFLHNVLV